MMAVKFFGQFLIENGIVTRENLLQAMELQERKNLKLGEMTLQLGYVSQVDITRAHNAQLSKDMRLGDLLVEMGMLSQEQLSDVITRQKNSHLFIGEALVLVNAMTSGQLQKQLEAFKADQSDFVSDVVELPVKVANNEIWQMAVDLTFKLITRILNIQFRSGKAHVVNVIPANFMIAAMDFSGDVEGCYMLSVNEKLQKTIAKAILREESVEDEPSEVLEDTVMEFVNIVCGNIAAKASQMGKIMEISPPTTIIPAENGIPVVEGHVVLCFPIHVGDYGKMELLIQIPN